MKSTNRFLLRELTREHHQKLDAEIGGLQDRAAYIRYTTGMAAFRSALEPQLRRFDYPIYLGGWRPTLILAELASDMRDLRAPPAPDILYHGLPLDLSGAMGVFYVIEGSTLGARGLSRRALALGFDASFGARHLHAQTAHPETWISFHNIMEEIETFDVRVAARSACETFQLAYYAFRRARHVEFAG